ncbi:transcriptional regulator [Burkholderia cenocepacia]|uniref:transcriptional regulator n=1 Tax=Burkholderia cenocepacia TaxID=95486 RepID=UPI002ABDE0F6|nr:YdaS family helix-turn-helix protein [Burkholderia cenocepacia]
MKPTNCSVPALEAAIQKAGSQSALARLIGKKQPHIHKWLHSPNPMRPENCVLVGNAVGIPYRDFRPTDWHLIWPHPAEAAAPGHMGACTSDGRQHDALRAGVD